MPIYDYECQSVECGLAFEAYRSLDRYKEAVPCEKCGGATEKKFLPAGNHLSVDPIIVFKASDGTYRFPGDANGVSARNYEKQGLERVELRNWADVRKFEQTVNEKDARKAERRMEASQAATEQRQHHMRRELNHVMNHGMTIRDPQTGKTRTMDPMSPMGRAVAKAAMLRNNQKNRWRSPRGGGGFHVEVYSNNRSNRDESRDAQGRRRRD